MILRALCFVVATAMSPVCSADIYGYVDEHGTVHLSDTQLDDRYFLFRKEVKPVTPTVSAPPEPVPAPGAVSARPRHAPKPLAELIEQVSREHDVDAALIQAVIAVESGFNARALSPKGARGLMQLMPATAERFGVSDVWNPVENIRAGTRYLKHLLTLFKQNVSLALAAYNAGEGAVIAAGHTIPPFAETRDYVPKVLRLWESGTMQRGNR